MRGILAVLAILFAAQLPVAAQTASPATIRDPARSSAELRRQLSAAVEAKDRLAVSRMAKQLACMGSTLSAAGWQAIAPHLDEAELANAPKCELYLWGWHDDRPQVEQLHRLFEFNLNPGHHPTPQQEYAEVPAEYRLVEGIALDKDRLFIGTVVDGRLAYLEKDVWHEVPLGSPRNGLFGMKADTRRRLLWIATGAGEPTAVTGDRMSGLIAVNLDTLKVAKRVPLAPGATGIPGDVAVASDGTVYVSNAVSGAIHRCRPGCTVLDDLVPAGTFGSPQGMVESADRKRLHVADYSTGLWSVALESGAISRLDAPVPMAMESIDGMVSMGGGALMLVQNGTNPRRIVSVWPRRDGKGVGEPWTHLVFPPGHGEPTLAVSEGSVLIYVADSQWERYGKNGALTDGKPPRPTLIRWARLVLPLNAH